MITIDNIYECLEKRKSELNFVQRNDVETPLGTSKFQTLFWDETKHDIPLDIKDFLTSLFKITEKDYDFIQIQKYEVGDYILPHKDCYPLFNLVMLSTSALDGIIVEQRDATFKFFPDIAGTFIDIPKFRWHWVSPVREKTRYTAVYGLNPITNYDSILDQ